ncbi:MAG: hypothetical protein ACYC6G_19995 [Desulfobaccales bacterium]
MTSDEQLKVYGQALTGEETELDLVKLQRIQYLKEKGRRFLDLIPFGDTLDIMTDLCKGVILGWAIQQGVVTDPTIINRFKAAVSTQLEFYGGPEFVIGMLEDNAGKLSACMSRYYQAKAEIALATDMETVMAVDIEDAVIVDAG